MSRKDELKKEIEFLKDKIKCSNINYEMALMRSKIITLKAELKGIEDTEKEFAKELYKINYEKLLSLDDYSEETQAEDGDYYDRWCGEKIINKIKELRSQGDDKANEK